MPERHTLCTWTQCRGYRTDATELFHQAEVPHFLPRHLPDAKLIIVPRDHTPGRICVLSPSSPWFCTAKSEGYEREAQKLLSKILSSVRQTGFEIAPNESKLDHRQKVDCLFLKACRHPAMFF